MTRRHYMAALLVMALAAIPATAQQRDAARMRTTARKALQTMVSAEGRGEVKELRSLSHCALMGYGDDADGGFAVVTNDGRQVLAVSAARRSADGENPAFEWWLRAADEALGRGVRHINRPNPKQYPISVAPLVQTHWGQMDPYNRQCFYDSVQQERTVTGCVATSMAQVLNYYRTPEHGTGQRTVYYPYQDSINGQQMTVNFADATYRWDLLDGMVNFREQTFTDAQAEAISTVMLHAGVAADMRYGTKGDIGSATTASAAAEGLRLYLQQPEARVVLRDNYDDDEWMDMVYQELSTGHPLIYGGQAFSGGHSFIVNGYDRDGLVYVNWGWNGDDEGYFDINLLNPGGTSFAERQDMIIGLCPTTYAPLAVQVTTTAAGTLASLLAQETLMPRCALTVNGPLNDRDFTALRTAVIDNEVGTLRLSEALFDALPDKALYGCTQLTALELPAGLKHVGDGALGNLRYLTDLTLVPADDADFVIDGGIIYNKEKTEIISVLSTTGGALTVGPQVTAIHPYAFSGCVLLESVELPATITRLGAETFRDCFWIESLKVRSKTAITLSGYDIFEGIDKQRCTLYVPSGLKVTYQRRAQWKEFQSIEEFGTTIKANNVVRKQGEPNPELGYTTSGNAVSGTPYLYTDATQDSPAGVYTIYVEAGTITDPDVEFVNGRLIVEENSNGISDATRQANGEEVNSIYDLQGRRTDARRTRRGISVGKGEKVTR